MGQNNWGGRCLFQMDWTPACVKSYIRACIRISYAYGTGLCRAGIARVVKQHDDGNFAILTFYRRWATVNCCMWWATRYLSMFWRAYTCIVPPPKTEPFLPRDAILARYVLSSCVCPSVRHSRYCVKTAKHKITQT